MEREILIEESTKKYPLGLFDYDPERWSDTMLYRMPSPYDWDDPYDGLSDEDVRKHTFLSVQCAEYGKTYSVFIREKIRIRYGDDYGDDNYGDGTIYTCVGNGYTKEDIDKLIHEMEED